MELERSVITAQRNISYQNIAQGYKDETWDRLGTITVKEAISVFLTTLTPITADSYQDSLRALSKLGYVDPYSTLQQFALVNHNGIIDRIKAEPIINVGIKWSEQTKQSKCSAYISFTGFLARRFAGMITKALPNKEGCRKTFHKIRDKVVTCAMTQCQWLAFFRALEKINPRDYLLAKVMLQGAKRLEEVLCLTTDRIDWARNEIKFTQLKTHGIERFTIITYPDSVMNELREYIGDRTGYVFITKRGKKLPSHQLSNTFIKAGVTAGIPIHVTPRVLRTTAITYLKQQGFADSDIMKVSGHASSGAMYAYDKSSISENASKKVCLIT